jgi:pimeloyl-ACP methyl ester carboxylesterase
MRAVEVLLAGVAAGCAGYVLVTYVTAFARAPRPPDLLRVALVEVGAALMLMVPWPLWLVLGASYASAVEGEGRARGRRRPVVLLHGFFMNRTQWLWLGRRLAGRGLGPLYGTSYFSPQSVAESARHLERFIEGVRAREDAERVDIVAHSLGGVVARYYIERLGGATRVGRLITIGSPHKGTRLGRFGLGLVPSAREIVAESPLLGGLAPPDGAAYVSVWSRADAVIIPADASSIAPAGEDHVFDDMGHLTMLLSRRVVDVIARRLGA